MSTIGRRNILISIKMLVALIIAFFISYTVFGENFRVIEPTVKIEIEATAQRNRHSGGSDVRIRYLIINGENIPFDKLNIDSDWQFMDGLVVAVNPKKPINIMYEYPNAETLEIGLQKHDGSGIVKISANDRVIKKMDLYSDEWENIVLQKNIAPVKIRSNPILFVSNYILCVILVFGFPVLIRRIRSNEKYIVYLRNMMFISGMVITLILSWFQLELSCAYESVMQPLHMELPYIFLNVLTGAIIYAFIFVIVDRVWLTNLLFSIFSFLVAIVNHYTIKFHGSPLSILEIKNLGTALNVINSYKIRLDAKAIGIIAIFLLCLCMSAAMKKFGPYLSMKSKRMKWICKLSILVFGTLGIYGAYFSDVSIKPQKTIGDRWEQSYHQYGYLACSVELIYRSGHAVDMPSGYSIEKIEKLIVPTRVMNEAETPDIILILNETFYDLRYITDLQTDVPFMENIDAMDQVVRGYAVVPSIGGRTNASEYELLTSNSLQLMQGITPFSILDLKNTNSIVSVLKQLGYHTTAAHSESSKNYFRGRAYPELGFDQIHFEEDFKNRDYYGNRIYYETDECLYNNLISWYEEAEQGIPQFMYLLTIQNHGEWDENKAEDDTVHVLNNYGDYQQQMNEYLSCIKKSDEAFQRLTTYFKSVNKPVIICMVGDHSPSFANAIIDDSYSEDEKQLRLRSVPFVIWSNYGLNNSNMGNISLNYLVPTVFEIANISSSPYYDYMLSLRTDVPVLTSYDVYWDKTGKLHEYTDETDYTDRINGYFYLEYNSMQKNRVQELFNANK